MLPFSQSSSVYISSTRFPSCLFVIVREATSLASNTVLIVGLLGPLETVADRLGRVEVEFFGVLEAELVGL